MTSEATSTTLEELLFLTKVYEEAELFEDMIACMKKYTTLKTDLNAEERDLLSRAYKNHSASKRTAWRVLNSLEKQSDVKDTNNITLIKQFKSKIEKELDDICNDALDLAETLLNTKDIVYSETRVHLLKMKAARLEPRWFLYATQRRVLASVLRSGLKVAYFFIQAIMSSNNSASSYTFARYRSSSGVGVAISVIICI